MERALTEEHPLAALVLGLGVVAMSWLWLRYIDSCSRWLLRALGPRFLRAAERRWWRVLHVYFGAAILFAAGVATSVAAARNL